MSSLSYGKTSSQYEQALEDAILKLEATLNSLKLNNPRLTDKVENIKMHINNSLRAQEAFDKSECEKEKKELMNPYMVSKMTTGGMKRNFMEFVTSDRHAIGIYKRCVYDIEGMDSAVQKLKNMPHESKLTHKKQQLLNSYTKHYDRFRGDLGMLLKFDNVEGKLKEEFASSHDVTGRREWKQNLSDWQSPDYPKKPAYYEKTFNIYP